jgi:hypothetical protein
LLSCFYRITYSPPSRCSHMLSSMLPFRSVVLLSLVRCKVSLLVRVTGINKILFPCNPKFPCSTEYIMKYYKLHMKNNIADIFTFWRMREPIVVSDKSIVNGTRPTSDDKCKSRIEVTYDHFILWRVPMTTNTFRLLWHRYNGGKVATIDSSNAILKMWSKSGLLESWVNISKRVILGLIYVVRHLVYWVEGFSKFSA